MQRATARRRVLTPIVTVALLLSSFFAASRTLPKLPIRPGNFPWVMRFPHFEVPESWDYFFAVPMYTELSQAILYHDLGASIANARHADILFIGDSRLPLGLRQEFIVPEAERLGLRVFSLACGYSEGIRFPLEVIKKYDLRPKVVVVSGGPDLFRDGMSEVAKQAMAMTRWEAAKQWLEAAGAWNLQIRLHALVPKIDFFGRTLHVGWIIYRSSRTGWWYPVSEPAGTATAQLAEDAYPSNDLVPLANELERELEARGAILVLTIVPYPHTGVGHLRSLAATLGVPVVIPTFDEVYLADDSHLTRDSAQRVSKAFWEQFIALPEVRARLSLGGANAAE